ncbi:unnamed protein product [Paramecium octaurelia]|uniref:Uncharacterized protein n=1 Tax=Paramecium octaurelia TaxID=43137 RepID=A0A8S1T043_PAROT|nr:unnamed protein product [Paramecium octaurelia]
MKAQGLKNIQQKYTQFAYHQRSQNNLLNLKHQQDNNFQKNNELDTLSKLKELNEINERIQDYQLLKYHKRSLSSQSNVEGFLNLKDQQIFLYLPYHHCKQHRRQVIRKLWKKYINVIISLFRYERARNDIYRFYIPRKKLYALPTPDTLPRNPRKRKKDCLLKLGTFGEYIEAQDELEAKQKRKEIPNFKKSPIYLKYQSSQVRINRILTKRNNNNSISADNLRLSPKKVINKLKCNLTLPPLIKLDKRLQRVFSNLGK